ncbi:MAG TPA: heme biosynthesis HemY N-terminal domain-containing protein [Stellaceae bacterium]|nr:heme biosynthesis HemY N-terminal domain-containing protein [Stellaceae bacterium]
MRKLVALVALLALAIAAATVANYPGAVDITWQGWEIDTSVGVLAAALAILALAIWLLLSLVAATVRLPRRFRRNRRERRRRLGELALTHTMVALAAGDAPAALRQANRAETLLGASPLTLMLSAHVAQQEGDEAGARRRYLALLEAKEGAFLGLRGLIGQALRAGDRDEALGLAARARDLRPNAAWAFETLFALQTRARNWEEARETLAAAARRRLLPAARAEHQRGAILYELSRAAEHAGERRQALSLAASAHELMRDVAAPAVRHARLLIAEGRRRPARRVVEQAWQAAPHPDLAAVWAELGGGGSALELVPWFEKLAAHNPDSPESAVALAEAALAAQLWGEARRHLGRAVGAAPEAASRQLCLLMARVEESEHPGNGQARHWFDRALLAPPDPVYVCTRCGGTSAEWQALCGHCDGFDTLLWRIPAAAVPPAAPALADPTAQAPLLPLPNGLAPAGQSSR